MKQLIVSVETFFGMVSQLIESGVTFKAIENGNDTITITFTGGY